MSLSPAPDSEESLSHVQAEPLFDDNPEADMDTGDSYFPPVNSRRSRENSTEPAILETLPLLRRPNIYVDRAKRNVSLETGCRRPHGLDDGGSVHDNEPLVRVQSGVKKVEAITMLWTKNSLIVAYVR